MTASTNLLSQEGSSTLFEKINPKIRQILESQGIVTPTAIQDKAYEPILAGQDIIAQSRTGSGKTIAFGLGAFAKIKTSGSKNPKILVLTPTRELADQIGRVFNEIFQVLGFQTLAITGGTSYHAQKSKLARGVDAIVATPGRFCDLMDQKSFSLADLEILVLDEMDEMLDFGFSEDILRIKKSIGKKVQTLLFSATFPQKVENIVRQMTQNPVKIVISPKDISTGQIEHEFFETRIGKSIDALVGLLLFYNPEHAIIFCRTREETKNVSATLLERGFASSVLNGEMGQRDRSDTMARFKQKKIRLLIATDVAARGIDVSELSHVINLNVPGNTDTYTHRAGRTGRAGATGKSWTIVVGNQRREYQFICSKLKFTPKRLHLPNPDQMMTTLLKNKIASLKQRTNSTSSLVKKTIEQYTSTLSAENAYATLKDMLTSEVQSMVGNFSCTEDLLPRQNTEFGPDIRNIPDFREGSSKPFRDRGFSDRRKFDDKRHSYGKEGSFSRSDKKERPGNRYQYRDKPSQKPNRTSGSWVGSKAWN